MTRQELAGLLGKLVDAWPNAKWDDTNRPGAVMDNYAEQLLPLDAAQVHVAIVAEIRKGGDFPPTAGKLYRRVIELQLDAPTWTEAHRWLQRYNQIGFHQMGEPVPARRIDSRRLRDEMPPLVSEFITVVGGGHLYDALDGGNAEARMRDKYAEFIRDKVEQKTLVGLPTVPGLRKLERANAGASIGEVLGHVVPQLEPGEGEAA